LAVHRHQIGRDICLVDDLPALHSFRQQRQRLGFPRKARLVHQDEPSKTVLVFTGEKQRVRSHGTSSC
jgi:hypothetical protein